MMFTDEKIFTRNGYCNWKNDLVWASSRADADRHDGFFPRQNYPISVMVALGATWHGLTEPYFFEGGERLNGAIYCDRILPFYKAQGDLLFGDRHWCLQQDGATAHTGRRSQQWCEDHLHAFIPKDRWPPGSPELNPLDYSTWDTINKNIDYGKVHTRNDLKTAIIESCREVQVDYLQRTIDSFLKRVYAVEQSKGEVIIRKYS